MQLQSSDKLNLFYKEIISLLLFTLPLSRRLTVPILVLLIIVSLVHGSFIMEVKAILKNKTKLVLVVFYFLILISVLYSQNIKAALFDVQLKLSFLLLPFAISATAFEFHDYKKFKIAFLQGNLVALVLCFTNACYHYYLSHQIQYFYYTNFSVFLHSSYFAMYLVLTISLIILDNDLRKKHENFIYIPLLSLGVFLCSSRSGLLVLLLVVFLFLLQLLIIERKYKVALLSLVLLALLAVGGLSMQGLRSRIDEAVKGITTKGSPADTNYVGNTYLLRTQIWKHSLAVIKQKPLFGVGCGDVKDELTKVYQKVNLKHASDFHLNAHNQFIQTALSNGFVGLLALLYVFYSLVRHGFKQNDFLAFAFVIVTSVSFLFESMLETQAGVVFFALFVVLFFNDDRKDQHEQKI